jgi:cation diffusion facilitator CzcD-associated flavoprotein CzcO
LSEDIKPAIHFVGFRDDRYWNAVKVWGRPSFIHRGWDTRARREIAEVDTVVFANGPHDQEPSVRTFNDIDEVQPL